MKSFWKIGAPITLLALICGTVIIWHIARVKINERKLAETANLCRARALQGDVKSQFDLGQMYYHGSGVPQDYTEALRWYHKAADQGDAKAQYAIGYLYYYGQGVSQNYAEALLWNRKAADQGNARAEDALAGMYYKGKGVPQDYTESVRWYRKAAVQGDAWGEDGLGFAYGQGQGVPRDYAEAVRWIRKAAEQGFASGQYDLGYTYYYGRGVPQDNAEAFRWFRKAANQGDERAQRVLTTHLRRGIAILTCVYILGSVLLLISSFRAAGMFVPSQRAATVAGLLGLTYAGLDLYGLIHIGLLESISAVNAFYFSKSILAGAFLVTLISIFWPWPRSAKILLRISAALFIGLNGFSIYVIAHYNPKHSAIATRTFYSANGWLIGVSMPLAIFLWKASRKRNAWHDDGVRAPEP